MNDRAQAAVLVSPRRIETREYPLPETGDDDALVRIEACGVCGTDYEWYDGELKTTGLGGERVPYPFILGHEPLGVVAVIGRQARQRWGVEVGDRVAIRSRYTCGRCVDCSAGRPCPHAGSYGITGVDRPPALWGGYADYLYVAPGSVVLPVERSIPAEIAVMFNPLGAGYGWAVDAPVLQPGASIAILGPGQRGLCAAIAAREAGAALVLVTGLRKDRHKLAVARELGVDHAVDVEADDPVEVVKEVTKGQGVDAVLDTTPYSVEATVQATRMVKAGGTVVIAGVKGGRELRGLSTDELVWKQITVKGVMGVSATAVRRAIETIESGRYPLHRLHTHSFRVTEASSALESLAGTAAETAIHVAIVP